MAVTFGQHTEAESQSGNAFEFLTHDTSGQVVLAGATLYDDGSSMIQVTAATPLPVGIQGNLPDTSAGDLAAITAAVEGAETDIDFIATTVGQDAPVFDGQGAQLGRTVSTKAHVIMFNGATWDRLRGDAADGLLVNLGTNNDVSIIVGQSGIAAGTGVDSANTPRVSLATDVPLPAGTNAIGKLAANAGVTIGAVEIAAAQTVATVTTVTTVTTLTGSSIAHDAVDSGNPHKVGGKAITAWPAAVADADRTNFVGDKFGRQLVVATPRGLRSQQQTTITSSTSETTIVTAGAAGVFNDVYGLAIANTSATDCNVTIKDATTGTTRMILAVKAGATAGFMLPSGDGHKQASAANNWTATCSASVASISITAFFVQMKDA